MTDILLTKLCNAFQPNAQAKNAHEILDNFAMHLIAGGMITNEAGKQANSAINNYQKKHGGLWVGGRFYVTKEEIAFSQNAMNKAFHSSNNDFSIPLSSITSIHREFGFVTGIIVIKTSNGIYKVRCFNAKGTVNEINEIIKSQLSLTRPCNMTPLNGRR